MLVAMLLSIVQPFLDIQVARAAIPAIEPIEPIDIVTGTVYQGTPNSVDILGGLAGAGGYDSGDQTNTAYLKFYLPSGTDYSNAKLSLTPMDSGVTGDISNLKVNIGSSDNWVVNEGFDQPLSILPTKHIGIGKDFSKPFYIFNQFDTPISLPIGDLLTNQNINDIGSENIITLILSSPTMMDDYAVFGNISIIDYDTSPPVEAKHKVSFNVDGGSLVPEQSITHGEKASEPPAPTKVGYTFEGWYTDDERTNQYDFTNNVITANTTLYAKWKPVGYKVNFEVNGGSLVPNQTVAHGEKATVPTAPTKVGYTFEGWYTDDEGTEQYDFTNNVVTANTTLYAKWEPVGYTVNFEVNGGSAIPSQSVAHGKKATVPTTPTKVGYTFEGWYTDDEGTEQYDFTNNVVTANTTLYAKWEPVGYTMDFEVNGGSAVPSQSVAHGKKATVPTTPTKVGYTFEGWYTDDEGTEQYDFTNNVVTANTTLYAKWEPLKYTVSFEVEGGSAVPSQSVAHGKKATVPTTPTKVGYTFEGWYTDDEGTEQYDFTNNVITANTTLYAKWKPLKYTVSFEVSGGSAVPSQTVAHGEKATVPPVPTKAGYTFEGWYTDDEGTNQYDFNTNVITANTTIYAKWKSLKYTVSFEVSGGSAVPNQTVAHGEKATVPPAPTKAGYTFEGWYTDDERTNQYDFTDNVITANTTLYAKWKLDTYTVNFEVNGGSLVPSQTVAHGEKATVPPAPTKAGYTFEGWYTDDERTNQYDFTDNVITVNTTLYAKWKLDTYTVNFEVNGGSLVPNQTVAHGEKVSKPTSAPTKAGYTFEGWYTSSTLDKLFDFNSSSITRNVTIYAKWVSIVSPPTSNDGNESSTPSTNTEHIVVDVDGENGVNLTKTPIIRTTMPDGVIKDHVSMSEDIAKETIEKAKQLGNDTARIIIPDANDKVSEVVVDIPKSSLAQIHAGNIQLEIATMNAIISIPNVSMSNFSNDLYFRLVPIKSLEQQHQVEERILKEELIKETLQSEKVNLIGRPMTIETNMQHRPVTLTLPLPKNITQEQLNNLAIFIEHSDGTKELLRGKVVDYQKDMLGLQFEVTKFSTFSILYLPEDENVEEPTTDDVTHTPYIQGYADGTFRPNAFVTRAQMASMFARQLTGNAIPKSNATFTDTAQHDAKDAIEFVKDASLFNGVTKTSFNPNGFITRAQMAAVAARWIEKHCVDNPNADFCKTKSEGNTFKDVSNNHWAVQAIATVNALGIMTGTTADTFNPDGNLTRAQAVKVLNRLFERQAPTEHQNPIFKDVQSNHWAFYEIQEAAVKHTHNK